MIIFLMLLICAAFIMLLFNEGCGCLLLLLFIAIMFIMGIASLFV